MRKRPNIITSTLFRNFWIKGADATKAIENESTKYYTIYGDWNPSLPCPLIEHEDELYQELERLNQIPNDGIVPVSSVESHAFLPHSTLIGYTRHCQTGLLADEEYNMAKNNVLMPKLMFFSLCVAYAYEYVR